MKQISEARKRTLALQERALRFSTGVNVNCPKHFTSFPSETVWRQLVRAADSVSNNLCEADDASSTADFVHKIRLTLREAKESRICLEKLRLARLDNFAAVLDLENEANELCAIFASIAFKVADRLDRERRSAKLRA
jgi:four helix bundle protein